MSGEPRPLVAIVDYGMGNRRSVEKALEHVGAAAIIAADHDQLAAADALILPGVGAFPRGMANLRAAGLEPLLHELVSRGTPLLGICLGMQLLFESSTELGEQTAGLGMLSGQVRALRSGGLRIPHIGWNEVRLERGSELTADLPSGGAPFYHVHSYAAADVEGNELIGTTEYGERFPTIVGRANVYGVQFHPEKSSRDGLRLLRGFVKLAQTRHEAVRA